MRIAAIAIKKVAWLRRQLEGLRGGNVNE